MNHRIIADVWLALLIVADVVTGVFVVGAMVGQIAPRQRRRLLLNWFLAFGLFTVPQYYLDSSMSDGHTRYWSAVANNWPVYLMFASGWIAAQVRALRREKG